jgi:Na+-driven multidrug efflux pump
MLRKIWKIGMPARCSRPLRRFQTFSSSRILTSSARPAWRDGLPTARSPVHIAAQQSLALSATTFVGRILGANNVKRAKSGTSRAVIISIVANGGPHRSGHDIRPVDDLDVQHRPEVLRYGSMLFS